MNYDFDTVWPCEGKDSTKWNTPRVPNSEFYSEAEQITPMWVADMDFATPQCVVDAIKERLDYPLFCYYSIPDRYYDAINFWQQNRTHNPETLTADQIQFHNSVLGGMASFLSVYTLPGEQVLFLSPIYPGFLGTMKNLGRAVCESRLEQDETGTYRINFADLEEKIKTNHIHAMIFCSPHNPTGRVWERWEIEQVVALCEKWDVSLLSDEIWSDFIMDPSCVHIPTQSVNETAKQRTIAMYSPTKTFNLAALVGAYSVIYNPKISQKIAAFANSTHYNGPNILSCYALMGAYESGADWVDELRAYIRANQEYVVSYINTHFKGVKAYLPQGTYLLWIDVTDCGKEMDELCRAFHQAGVIPNDGRNFYATTQFRLNVACPRSICELAMQKMHQVFDEK